MKERAIPAIAVILLSALLLGSFVFVMPQAETVSAAPAPAITPVAGQSAIGGSKDDIIKFYDAEAITADEQTCFNMMPYRIMDVEYVIDQGTTNTTTITLRHTLGTGEAALTTTTTGQTIVSANAADADDLNRFDLYGKYTCVYIDVTNTNPVTVSVWALPQR